jgi:hypothetical protein
MEEVMPSACPMPREPAAPETLSTRAAARARGAAAFGIAFALFTLSGCSIIFPPGFFDDCPETAELCPDLECEYGFAVNAEGCDMCECAEPSEPEVCWDEGDCATGQLCDTVNFCETPPGCTDDQPCPAVCYGRCVDAPDGCNSDADCGAGEACRFESEPGPIDTEPGPAPGEEEEPSGAPCNPDVDGCVFPDEPPPSDPPEERPAPEGTCVPVTCPAIGIPDCPAGTELVFDFSDDDCGTPSCVPVDDCRALDPELCEAIPGCHVESVPTPCPPCQQGEDCICEDALLCVPDGECRDLDLDACEASDECEPVFFGGSGARPACFEECDANGTCEVTCPDEPLPEPPPEEFVCAPIETPPPPTGECFDNFDCGEGQVCEILELCGSSCDGGPNGDVACTDVCEIIGFCVDEPEPPPPATCESNDECGLGYVCEDVEICESSCGTTGGSGAPPPDDNADPIPCEQVCELVGQCTWNPENVTCFFEGDCETGQVCEMLDQCVIPPDCPNCLVACMGICTDPATTLPEGVCEGDGDCGADERCATELDECVLVEGIDGCFSRCVEVPQPANDVCLEEADCGEGFRCATEVDSCYCPEGQQCDLCYWQCVPEDNTAP